MATYVSAFTWSSDFVHAVTGIVVAAAMAVLLIVIFLRQVRNGALEEFVLQNQLKLPVVFHGTLDIEQHKPGDFLRLCKNTRAARTLQFRLRWLEGVGRQPIFDEVVFDRSRTIVELKTRGKTTAAHFLEFSAIRMRERAGRGGVSSWRIDLVPRIGRPIPFVLSAFGSRQAAFENTAPIAKAVSVIMGAPVEVIVAGNTWTPGWPPKASATSKL